MNRLDEEIFYSNRYALKKHNKQLKRKRNKKKHLITFKQKLAFYQKITSGYTNMVAPENFSILRNHDEIIKYFSLIREMLENQIYTAVDLENIKHIDLATLCLLSSFMLDERIKSKYLRVIGPRITSSAHRMFREAQFEEMIIERRKHEFKNGGFLSVTNTKINDDHANMVITNTTKFFGLTNGKVELKGLWPIIVEVVTNVNNHASSEKDAKIPWLINTHERLDNGVKTKSFCVIDLGVGIYESVATKTKQWELAKKRKLRWMLDITADKTQNQFFSKHIPNGIESTTKLPERGKGMRNIYEDAQSDIFKNFTIITNKSLIDVKNISKVQADSKYDFEGTIYYWEIALESTK